MTLTQDAPPVQKGQLTILDGTGDTEVSWDPANEEETAAAKAMFDSLTGTKRYLAYRKDNNEVINQFDPNAREIVLKPQTQGG